MKKIAYLAKNIIKNNFSDLKVPYRLTYIVTYKCQFRCNMCNIWRKEGDGELSLEEIKRFFQRSNKFSWINLSGGEIFLRKDLFDIVTTITDNCRYLYLLDFPTNGFNTEAIVDFVKKIKELRIPKILVTVSLDGPPKLHDQIRGVNGAWQGAINTFIQLVKLRDKRFDVYFGMTIQPLNMERFGDTVESIRDLYKGIKYNDFHVNIIHSSGHYYDNAQTNHDAGLNKLSLQREMEKIRNLRKHNLFSPISYLERKYQKLSDIYFRDNTNPIICQALSASFFMDPYGTVYPCSIYNKPIGNIADFGYDINEVWNSQKRKELRLQIKNNECPGCWTPCEAYQSILANLFPKMKLHRKRK